jgi:hypothetical protein
VDETDVRANLDELRTEVGAAWASLEYLGLRPRPRSLTLSPEWTLHSFEGGEFCNSRSIPVRISARFALQVGPTLRPAAGSVSKFHGSVPFGTDLGLISSLTEAALS